MSSYFKELYFHKLQNIAWLICLFSYFQFLLVSEMVTLLQDNNVPLKNTIKAFHLGHSLSNDDDDSIVNAAIAQFWRSFNLFSTDFGHISLYLQCKLFKQYCCSFYGLHCGLYLVILSIRLVLHGGKL